MPETVSVPWMEPPRDPYDVLWTPQPGGRSVLCISEFAPSDYRIDERIEEDHRVASAVDPKTTPPEFHVRLRDYQIEAADAVFKHWEKGAKAPLLVLPTASGKTICAAEIIRRHFDANHEKVIFFAHRKELLEQTVEKVRLVSRNTTVGLVQADTNELGRHVTVASIQTIGHKSGRRLDELLKRGPYGLIIIDEAHHAPSTTYARTIATLRDRYPTMHMFGMTATPGRADGLTLDKIFDVVAYQKQLLEMIDEGWLVPPRGFRVHLNVDLTKVASQNGDFVQTQLSRLMNTPPVVEAVVRAWMQYGHDRKMLVYAVDIAHAYALSDAFNNAGYPAGALSERNTPAERKKLLGDFRKGDLRLLVNVEVLTEGYDDPSAEGVVFARPTQSQTLYTQAIGRSLRLHPSKTEAIIIDCVGNTNRHQLVQLASIIGYDPVTGEKVSREMPEKEEASFEINGVTYSAEEVSFARPRQTKYRWRETSAGWCIEAPHLGYFLITFSSTDRTRAIARFYDLRKGREYTPAIDLIKDPLPFDMLWGMVESELTRLFNAKRPKNDDRPPSFLALTDIEEGVDEPLDPTHEQWILTDAEWRKRKTTEAQHDKLRDLGVKEKDIPELAGESSDLIAVLKIEHDAKMRVPATPKQLAYLRVNGIAIPGAGVTKGQAMRLIVKHRKAASPLLNR